MDCFEAEKATAVARMVGLGPRPFLRLAFGALAQLGEHLLCKQRVIGSIPIGSTKNCGPHRFGGDANGRVGSSGG